MREPSEEFVTIASTSVLTLSERDPKIEEKRVIGVPICKLTDLHLLDQQFPTSTPGTLYHLFSTCYNLPFAVVVVEEFNEDVVERAILEAALGLMDNPAYR